jgi:NIPSNAP
MLVCAIAMTTTISDLAAQSGRFHWTNPAPDAARWEQAFSADGGRSWETNWIMEFTRAVERCCPIIELRQYTLHPGRREVLIDLFDREFVETQEASGMTIVAQFRDIDRPDVFTWIRGFPDMPSRAKALESFYFGPVWARHKKAANATMISSDNVRLMHPARSGSGFAIGDRAGPGASAIQPGLVVATIYTLTPSAADSFGVFFDHTVAPILAARGVRPFGAFETEASVNTFPRLPVREGERAFVWFAHFEDVAAYDQYERELAADRRWTAGVRPELDRSFAAPVEIWRLTPTARSRTLR